MPSRRHVLALIAGAGLPGLLVAQPARVGVLMSGARASATAWLQDFRRAAAASGASAAVELRFADGKVETLPALAAELANRRVVAIVAADAASFQAAKASGAAPVLAGSALTVLDVAPREIDVLAAFLPKLSRIAVLLNPANAAHRAFFNAIGAAAERKGWRALGIEVEDHDEFEQAFDSMRKNRIGAVVLADDPLFSENAVFLAGLARQRRFAAVGQEPSYAGAGCLFSCGEDQHPRFDAIAAQVARVLRGGKPAEEAEFRPAPMPVVVNRGTAKAIGAPIPASVQKMARFV